jgi:hypothetical protein
LRTDHGKSNVSMLIVPEVCEIVPAERDYARWK